MAYQIDIKERTFHFKQPAGTSRGIYTTRKSWMVEISDGQHTGIGECAPLPKLSCDDIPDYELVLRRFCDELERTGTLCDEELRHYPSMCFGLETALLSLRAGGSHVLFDNAFSRGEEGIPMNGLVWMGTHDEMLARLEEKLRQGFHCIKIKIGAIDFDQEMDLIRHIRSRYSEDDVEIRVDANGGFTFDEAFDRLVQLSQLDLHSIEQPIRAGEWGAACRLMVNAGYSMYFMKEKAKGLGYLLRAQKQLAKATDLPQLRTLSYCYGQLMNCLWIDNTDEAIRFGKLREALLDSIEHHFASIPEGYLDKQRALTFSKMADFYAQKKDFQQARTYEQKFLATNLSKTARGNQLILDYYCTLGDFPRIQQTYHRSLPYWEHKDTFCSRYANVLGMLSDACTSQGLLQKALDYRTRQVRIKDSLIIHDNENEAIRLSAIYETHDKEIELEKKRADAQHYLLLAFSALVLFLLACAFAVYYYRQQIRMHRKNLLLISQMDTETRDKESSPRSQQLEVPIASTDVSATEPATIDTVSIVAEPDVVAHTSTIPEYRFTPPIYPHPVSADRRWSSDSAPSSTTSTPTCSPTSAVRSSSR